jgi:5-methylcytosine-specific restriction endonuclease McrBC regulatory subunit McrC
MVILLRVQVTLMKQLNIKDNQFRQKSDFEEVKHVVECVSDKTLEQLEREGVFVFPEFIRDTDDITREQMILQSYNEMYVSGNVMGFLGAGDERLVIESRFSSGENDFFFQYLLYRVLGLPNFINLNTNANQEDRMFSLLIFLFPHYLKRAARKGVFKTYIRRTYNDDNVRGIIEVPRHIRKNTPFVGKIAYSQREHSFDNYLMQLVRHTIEYIKSKSYGYQLLSKARDEVKLVVDATHSYHAADRRKILETNRKSFIRHAYYHEYRDLQRLCILILHRQKHYYAYGKQRMYGILFDGAWLWEEYVAKLLGKAFYHPMNTKRTGTQHLFDNKEGKIYPDFISKNSNNRVIADAKYKPAKNISSSDYLQVLAYMYRFDASKGYYLYPENEGNNDRLLWMNEGVTYEKNVKPRGDICVKKHGLRIPVDANTYDDFVYQIKSNEEKFNKGILCSE